MDTLTQGLVPCSKGSSMLQPTDWPPASVTVDGKPVPQGGVGQKGWTFEGNTLTTVIPTASFSTASKVVIEVRRDPKLMAQRNELDGFAGAMTRLRDAYHDLQKTSPVSGPPDALIDAMQTGDRISYHPQRAAEEIAHFQGSSPVCSSRMSSRRTARGQTSTSK